MKRILFVDDEPAVLEGLRNLLRNRRSEWEMTFVPGGKAALEELARAPFDAVVSDMRMPGMDGAELLRAVKEQYPATARMVLSGHAEQDMVNRASPVAQQYLTKPCDSEVLRGAIERLCELQSRVAGTAVREIVGRLDKLPSIPDTYFTLTRSIENPTARTDDIARIVQRDPAMCVKVLQLVNSAYFGLSRPLSSVAHAIGYLGLDLLRGLALTLNVFAATGPRGSTGTSFERLQQTAILTARVAKQLVSDPSEAEAAFTAGLVHDIGTIILALTVPDRYAEITRRSMQTRSPSHVIEREVLGATHAEVGGYLLGVWGLPLPIVEAVAYHHGPPPARRQRMDTAMALYIGDALAGQALAGHDAHEGAAELDLSGLEQAGVAVAQELPRWRDLADREARAMLAREMNKREAAAI